MLPSLRASLLFPRWSVRARRLHESRTVNGFASTGGAASLRFCSRFRMGSSKYVSWFADIGLNDRPYVGGKGGSLGELQRAGIAVPPGFVVRTEAFERLLAALERESPIRTQVE